jgi:hypothetical protein
MVCGAAGFRKKYGIEADDEEQEAAADETARKLKKLGNADSDASEEEEEVSGARKAEATRRWGMRNVGLGWRLNGEVEDEMVWRQVTGWPVSGQLSTVGAPDFPSAAVRRAFVSASCAAARHAAGRGRRGAVPGRR